MSPSEMLVSLAHLHTTHVICVRVSILCHVTGKMHLPEGIVLWIALDMGAMPKVMPTLGQGTGKSDTPFVPVPCAKDTI